MKDFLHNNGILLLVVAVLLALITLVTSALLRGTADPVGNAVGVVTTPVRNAVNSLAGWVSSLYDRSFRYEELEQENEQLRRRIAEMEEAIRQAESANTENERLRTLLDFQTRHKDFDMESAMITALSPTNWESTFTISKGSDAGLLAGQCVVDQYGYLVGEVSEVGLNWATVTTLVDTDTELGGLIGRTDEAAILEGDFSLMGEGKLKLTYLPQNSTPVQGDQILTSGRGGVYPAGVVVGTVESVRADASGMGRYAVIAPATDLIDLQQVFVIRGFDIVN